MCSTRINRLHEYAPIPCFSRPIGQNHAHVLVYTLTPSDADSWSTSFMLDVCNEVYRFLWQTWHFSVLYSSTHHYHWSQSQPLTFMWLIYGTRNWPANFLRREADEWRGQRILETAPPQWTPLTRTWRPTPPTCVNKTTAAPLPLEFLRCGLGRGR